jgi:glycine cleavage system H lipoate-binding protein
VATIDNFLGQTLTLPEDRLYSPSSHFWFREVGEGFDVGVSEPGIALTGGLVELEVLAETGADVVPGEEVAFATTRKAIKFFLTPLGGTVAAVNGEASAEAVNDTPYATWLFRMRLPQGSEAGLVEAPAYAAKLAASEHATAYAAQAAAAAKAGKASPTCRSIYSGIKE